MLVAMPCASKALLSLVMPFSCVLALLVGCRSRSCGLGLHQRVWIISFIHVYACSLLCFVSMFNFLDLGFAMLCALHGLMLVGLWGHLLVWLHLSFLWLVWMWLLVRHISMMWVCLIHTFSHSVRWCYACLACFVPPVWLSLLLCNFACLATCLCMSLCVVHIPIS